MASFVTFHSNLWIFNSQSPFFFAFSRKVEEIEIVIKKSPKSRVWHDLVWSSNAFFFQLVVKGNQVMLTSLVQTASNLAPSLQLSCSIHAVRSRFVLYIDMHRMCPWVCTCFVVIHYYLHSMQYTLDACFKLTCITCVHEFVCASS